MNFDRAATDSLRQIEYGAVPPAYTTMVAGASKGDEYEVPIYTAPTGGSHTVVNRITVRPMAAITGADTNIAAVYCNRYHASSQSGTMPTLASLDTATDWALLETKTLFDGALMLDPGDMLTFGITTEGDGAATPAFAVTVEAATTASFAW